MRAKRSVVARDRLVALGVLAVLVCVWQALSVAFPEQIVPGVPMVPGWQVVFSTTLLSLSNYWPGGWGFGSVAAGDPESYLYAALAIIYHTGATLFRFVAGFAIGTIVGTVLGLSVSWSSWGRRIVNPPVQLLRVLPLLALLPLFQIWFGLSQLGEICFVAYGVGVIFFAATANAVGNVPRVYIENARTFGARRLFLYRTVIIPAILPELHSATLLALGAAWSAVLGAEFLGAQSGLGYIIVYSQSFGFLDRMFLIALLVIVYATLTYWLASVLFRRINAWSNAG